MKSFWLSLPRPFLALAPMEDVTDTVFRRIVASCARPDVFFTEFTNVDGMASIGNKAVTQRLRFTEEERPIVAQLWGLKPENFYKAAQEIVRLGFDGIDINMGCPEKSVVKKGACIALINNRTLATEVIQATMEGASTVIPRSDHDEGSLSHDYKDNCRDSSLSRRLEIGMTKTENASRLPVSIKTRIGFGSIITEDWIGFLLSHGLDALTIHGRTAKEESNVPCHWDEIGKAVKVRDAMKLKTLVIGNGDVADAADALDKVQQYGVDGVMIGRGTFHNLWAFDRSSSSNEHTREEKLALLLFHARLFEKEWGTTKNFVTLKKYFKIYTSGFDQASELREKLMTAKSVAEVSDIIKNILT